MGSADEGHRDGQSGLTFDGLMRKWLPGLKVRVWCHDGGMPYTGLVLRTGPDWIELEPNNFEPVTIRFSAIASFDLTRE